MTLEKKEELVHCHDRIYGLAVLLGCYPVNREDPRAVGIIEVVRSTLTAVADDLASLTDA